MGSITSPPGHRSGSRFPVPAKLGTVAVIALVVGLIAGDAWQRHEERGAIASALSAQRASVGDRATAVAKASVSEPANEQPKQAAPAPPSSVAEAAVPPAPSPAPSPTTTPHPAPALIPTPEIIQSSIVVAPPDILGDVHYHLDVNNPAEVPMWTRVIATAYDKFGEVVATDENYVTPNPLPPFFARGTVSGYFDQAQRKGISDVKFQVVAQPRN